MVVQCCVCKRIRTARAQWVQPKDLASLRGHVSHGYCPACAEEAFQEIRAAHEATPLRPAAVANA